MKNSELARKAVKVYPHTPYTDRKQVNHLRREWMSKIKYLGDKWILAKANHIARRDLA